MLEAREALCRAECVLVATHVSPDVDAIGSLLAFGLVLDALGLKAVLLSEGGIPYEAAFLPGTERVADRAEGQFDLAVILDCPRAQRIGDAARALGGLPVMNIDHHETNALFGQYNIVEPRMASTTQLVYRFAAVAGVPVSGEMATCLLAGLVGDTQGFRTPGTDLRVLRDAVALMAAGADLWAVNQGVFNATPRNHVGLWGRVLSGAVVENGLVWATIPMSTWREAEVPETEDTGLVNFLLATQGTLAAALFSEDRGGKVRVSFRSVPGVDVASVARAFGGGGHRQAAGCRVSGSLEEVTQRVLEQLRQVVHGSSQRSAAS